MLKHVGEEEGAPPRPESPSFYDEIAKHVPWYHKVLLSNPLKVAIALSIFAILAPTLVFFFFYQNVYEKNSVTDGFSSGTCAHNTSHRLECGLDLDTRKDCPKNCCFDEDKLFCYHYLPSRFSYFVSSNVTQNELTLKPRQVNTPYKSTDNMKQLGLKLNEVNERHFNFIIFDKTKEKFNETDRNITNKMYTSKVYRPEMFIEIFATELGNDSKPLLSTSRGPLIVSKNIWEWTFHLSDEMIYGLGELILEPGMTRIIYNSDGNSQTIPFLMSQREGIFYGVFFENQGPMEIKIIGSRAVNIRCFSGDRFSVHFLYGPKPPDVIKMLVDLIGKPDLPPYWALGAHFCRRHALAHEDVTLAFEAFNNFTETASTEKLPYDSDCISDDVYQFLNSKLNDTEGALFEAAVSRLAGLSKSFLSVLRPHIRLDNSSEIYNEAVKRNILIMDPYDEIPFEGWLNEKPVVYPDYSMQKTRDWLKEFWPFNNITTSFVLKDNWPKNEDTIEGCSVNLPYVTDLINQTLCGSIPWNAREYKPNTTVLHFNTHNMYGNLHSMAISNTLLNQKQNQDSFMMTSSKSFGIPTASHIQNVNATWGSFKQAFQQAVASSISGSFITSVPICGDSDTFDAKTLEHLCIKWYLASVYLPVFTVTSINEARDPFVFSGFAKNAMIRAIQTRYKLLPYFNTVLNAEEPLLRPMFYDFDWDNGTWNLDEQFMIGSAILVAPNFLPSQSSVSVYLPEGEEFYDLWGGSPIKRGDTGNVDIPTSETQTATLIRAGNIIAVQETTFTTAQQTRLRSNYTLIVALDCASREQQNYACYAEGSMFVANHTSWEFQSSEHSLLISAAIENTRPYLCGANNEKISSSLVDRIKIYGLNQTLNNFGDYLLIGSLGIDFCDSENGDIISVDYF